MRVPDLDSVDSSKLNVHVNNCNTLQREFRGRFCKEYLRKLVQRVKEFKWGGGYVVLIEQINKKRVMWRTRKIVKIYICRDGASRVVQMKTSIKVFNKINSIILSTRGVNCWRP